MAGVCMVRLLEMVMVGKEGSRTAEGLGDGGARRGD